jgi:orotidine-5'-phosphate decarboxylase
MPGLIAALDTADLARAVTLADAVSPHCAMVKAGLELFAAHGPAGVRALAPRPVFLDLKLHDIPNTVAGAVKALMPLAPRMLTLHAGAGGAALEAARRAAGEGESRPLLLGVTVLTSLDASALHGIGVAGGPRQQVLRLARLATAAGLDGLVCGPQEVAMLRDALGAAPVLVVPGVRPAGEAASDQARVATPGEAARAGANWIVVGRSIAEAPDPVAAAARIAREIA